jgi:hypothetical protein
MPIGPKMRPKSCKFPDPVERREGNTLAFVRFKDPGMPYELDTETDGIITMHLPSAMFPSIIDAVRNEKTDNYYQIGRAFLLAKSRRAGQGV